MYATYLSTHGVRVKTAEDGPSAVATALESRPDIIVMDLMLPRVDGWQAIRAIKADPHSADIPIVACTAHVLRHAVEDAIDDAYVTKPCPPEDLLVEIQRVLRWKAESKRRRRRKNLVDELPGATTEPLQQEPDGG